MKESDKKKKAKSRFRKAVEQFIVNLRRIAGFLERYPCSQSNPDRDLSNGYTCGTPDEGHEELYYIAVAALEECRIRDMLEWYISWGQSIGDTEYENSCIVSLFELMQSEEPLLGAYLHSFDFGMEARIEVRRQKTRISGRKGYWLEINNGALEVPDNSQHQSSWTGAR